MSTLSLAAIALFVVALGCSIRPLPRASDFEIRSKLELDEHGIFWVEQDLPHGDAAVDLGLRPGERSSDPIKPVVHITRGDNPAADAMVFCQLDNNHGESIGGESSMIYLANNDTDTALYEGVAFDPPEELVPLTVRFRARLPETPDKWTHQITVPWTTDSQPE